MHEPNWDKSIIGKLSKFGLTMEKAWDILGLLVEELDTAYQQGYAKGYNEGYEKGSSDALSKLYSVIEELETDNKEWETTDERTVEWNEEQTKHLRERLKSTGQTLGETQHDPKS